MMLRPFFRILCFSYLLIGIFPKLQAQKTEMNATVISTYTQGVKLYNNKAYAAAQELFLATKKKDIIAQHILANAAYYEAMCAIKLHQVDADTKVLQFVADYPNSNKKEKAFLLVGNYYFANKKAAYALKWYSKVNSAILSKDQLDTFRFKKGYALLVTNHLTAAKALFKTLLSNPVFGDDARYYFGYIAYKQEDYNTAEASLIEISDVETYKSKASYYLLDISFKAGRFEKCIEIGEKLLPTFNKKDKAEVSKIIGESYFNLQKYQEAIPFLKAYRGRKGRWNNTDHYQLGYAYFKQKDFKNAASYFSKIIGQKNVVSQNAYYNLGECHLQLQKKSAALNAFKNASEMTFDLKIQEDAALNYAKLSYEIGNPYKSIPAVLQAYLTKYPQAKQNAQIRDLLITAYLNQQDYQGALTYLSAHPTITSKELVHEISLYRGLQLFNKKNLLEARTHLTTANASKTADIREKARYWNAEISYRLGNYQEALTEFKSIENTNIETLKLVKYHIGYCYFKQKKYADASPYFKAFLQQKTTDLTLHADAMLRLGDSYYATKNYEKAIETYSKHLKNNGSERDYALFQKGMSYGFAGSTREKLTSLETLIDAPDASFLKDDALFQLASTYTALKEHENAHNAYNKLQDSYLKSVYIPASILRQGLLYYSDDNHEDALLEFKEIVARYPNTNEAKQAVAGARNVYIDLGDVAAYALWTEGISFVNVSDSELENTMYEAAENKFLAQNTPKALLGFEKYLQKFPQGVHALKAHFHSAQLLVKSNNKPEAIPHYQAIINDTRNKFTEVSLNKLAQLHLEVRAWDLAIPVLTRLEEEANRPQNVVFSQQNLMKSYYETARYTAAISAAEKVLKNNKIATQIQTDALLIAARSCFTNKLFIESEKHYTSLDPIVTGALKAETLYYKSLFHHKNKQYENSNTEIQKLIAGYASYKDWGVRSYLIMAKNQYALKDAYQATYILENIIQNFPQYEALISEAKTLLDQIKEHEAKTNESVNKNK